MVPGDRDDQHRGVPGPPEQVPDEQQRVVVGPLEVVEHEQQRALLGGRRHQVGHRREQPGPTGAAGGPPGTGQGRQHRGELGRRLVAQRRQLVGWRGGHQPVQCLHHRLVGDDRLLVAPPEQHQALVADAPRGLGGEPGLADPGLAGDHDHVAGAGGRLAPGLGQDPELPLPAHERRRPGRPCRRRGRGRRRRATRPPQQVEVGRLGLGRGIDAELVGQAPPQPLVGAQGLGPVAAAASAAHRARWALSRSGARATAASAAASARSGSPAASAARLTTSCAATDVSSSPARTSSAQSPGWPGRNGARSPSTAADAPARAPEASPDPSASRAAARDAAAPSTSTASSTPDGNDSCQPASPATTVSPPPGTAAARADRTRLTWVRSAEAQVRGGPSGQRTSASRSRGTPAGRSRTSAARTTRDGPPTGTSPTLTSPVSAIWTCTDLLGSKPTAIVPPGKTPLPA